MSELPIEDVTPGIWAFGDRDPGRHYETIVVISVHNVTGGMKSVVWGFIIDNHIPQWHVHVGKPEEIFLGDGWEQKEQYHG